MSSNEIACFQVHDALVLIADGAQFFEVLEIDPTIVDRHLEVCADCRAELEAERKMHELMQTLLRGACCETAPQELHDSIHMQIHNQGAKAAQYVTEFKMSQVSIEIDEFGNVIHQEIHIEGTQEFGNPEVDNQ